MCGKAVCNECSLKRRRLSQTDRNFYRVCEYCDNKILNKAVIYIYNEYMS